VPGLEISEELRHSIKEPRIFGAVCEIEGLITFLDRRDRSDPKGLVGSLFCQDDTFQDFVNITEDNNFDHIISIPLYHYNILVDYFAI